MAVLTFDLVCAKCQSASVRLENVDLTTFSPGEAFDTFEKHIQKFGWAMRRNPDPKLMRQPVCPACIKAEADIQLPAFVDDFQCPKCGRTSTAAKFFTGHESSALVPIEHIRRTCDKCGFMQAQRTLS